MLHLKVYWLNYWHILVSKGTSCFPSNTQAPNFYLGNPGSQQGSLEYQNGVRHLNRQLTENRIRYASGPVRFTSVKYIPKENLIGWMNEKVVFSIAYSYSNQHGRGKIE